LYISHSAEGLLIFYFCLSATAYILSLAVITYGQSEVP
jgi:hypothetical protein